MRNQVKLLITGVVVLAALLLKLGLGTAFFLGLLIVSVSGVLGARWSVAAGLVCLAFCPLLLLIDKTAWLQQSPLVNYYLVSAFGVGVDSPAQAVNEIVTWAYYFLCIGVATHLFRYINDASRKRRSSA